MRRISIAVLTLAVASAGCYRAVDVAPAHEHDVIAQNRLTLDGGRPLADVIAARWPTLMSPPVTSFQPRPRHMEAVGVYADRAYIGEASALRGILAREVLSVRRLSRVEEFARYGQMHDGGGIEIVWKRSALGPR